MVFQLVCKEPLKIHGLFDTMKLKALIESPGLHFPYFVLCSVAWYLQSNNNNYVDT